MSRANPYVADRLTRQAKSQGYAARSVFKLIELDRRYKILRRGDTVIDLGCHPGSWLKYAAERVGPRGRAVGIDLQPTDSPAPNATTITADITEVGPDELGIAGADVVLADLAPKTIGHAKTDALRSMALAERSLDWAEAVLRPGGRLVSKVFVGGDERELLDRARRVFGQVKFHKPPASRKQSRETYLIALGFKGAFAGS